LATALLGGAATRQLLAHLGEFLLGDGCVTLGCIEVDTGLLQTLLEFAAFTGRSLATLGRVGESLGRDCEITLETTQLQSRAGQVVHHRGTMTLGCRTGRGGGFTFR